MEQGNQNYDKVDGRELQRGKEQGKELLCVVIECELIKSLVLTP